MYLEFGILGLVVFSINLIIILVTFWMHYRTPKSSDSLAREKNVVDVADFESDGYYEPLPSLGEKGYFVKQLSPEVYFFSTGTYNNIFIVTSEGIVITDPIKGKGKLLKHAIREISQPACQVYNLFPFTY